MRIAVEELLGECCGGAEGGDDFDAGGVLVGCGQGGHDGLEIGGCGDVDLFRRLGVDACGGCEKNCRSDERKYKMRTEGEPFTVG